MSSDMQFQSAIRYSDDLETLQPNEAENIQTILQMMAKSQMEIAEKHRHAHRDAHAKSHAILKGTMTVHENLPVELAQGIFESGNHYEVVARLSSALGDIQSDDTPTPRGFAVKVMDVAGDRLLDRIEGNNQDFLMVNVPTIAFGDVEKYLKLLKATGGSIAANETFQKVTSAAANAVKKTVEAVGGTTPSAIDLMAGNRHHMLGETFHTQAAIRYGDYVAKLSLHPQSSNVRELTGHDIKGDGFSAMRDAVGEFFANNDATYTLCVQLMRDVDKMPIEDASVLWDEELSPMLPIATFHFEAQQPYTNARQVYGDDVLSFNPWNGVAAHRPLGSIMRVRKDAYERSTQFRHERNQCERREPNTHGDIPDRS